MGALGHTPHWEPHSGHGREAAPISQTNQPNIAEGQREALDSSEVAVAGRRTVGTDSAKTSVWVLVLLGQEADEENVRLRKAVHERPVDEGGSGVADGAECLVTGETEPSIASKWDRVRLRVRVVPRRGRYAPVPGDAHGGSGLRLVRAVGWMRGASLEFGFGATRTESTLERPAHGVGLRRAASGALTAASVGGGACGSAIRPGNLRATRAGARHGAQVRRGRLGLGGSRRAGRRRASRGCAGSGDGSRRCGST